MLSSAVSPHLYCFNCNLGIFISTLMVVGCLTVVIVVFWPAFNNKTKPHAKCVRDRKMKKRETQSADLPGQKLN